MKKKFTRKNFNNKFYYKYGQNEYISLKIIEKIYDDLACTPNDMISFELNS